MSMKLTAQVLDMKVGSATRKLVLVCMADIAGKDGTCFPSYKHIADQCEMSKRAVIEHIKQLELDGLVKKHHRKTTKGNSSNIYKITLPHGADISPPPSAESAPPSENPAPPPSAESAPRTSHSFEPVNEPKERNARAETTESEKSAERVAFHLFERLVQEIPEAKTLNPQNWISDIDRAIRIDSRSETELMEIIDWMHTGDRFWVRNIQSGKKLRDKYITMIAQKRAPKSGGNQRATKDFSKTDYRAGTEGFETNA